MSAPDDAAASRWRQLQSIFDGALDLPISERAAWIARACGDDAALRDEVSQLVQAADVSGDFLEQPIAQVAGPLIARELESMGSIPTGTRVGPYRVISEIGRGGMGVVCLAERADGEYTKRVALKVVLRRPGLEQWSIQRFRAERQILASLEHPGIARMLDGGMWEGSPWFAMEYADGLPIDEYCVVHGLPTDERLELFAAVCDAVQHAHDRTIIHRDLKPTNILVVNGAVKLLDFGIASLSTDDRDDAAARDGSSARPAVRSMTPGYASPEQIRGEPATAASDVYSLGVLLNRMLTGSHHPAADTLPDALRVILRTALHDVPGERYPTAGALGAAVRGYLTGRAEERRPARTSNSIRIARPSRQTAAVTGIVLVAALVAVGRLVARRPDAPTIYGASAIAVMPFQSGVADSAVERLGRDLAITLSADLDGMGDIRTVDPQTVLARRPLHGKSSTLGADVALARSLGVGRLLRGSVASVGNRIRVDAALYALDRIEPIARATTTVTADDVASATDSLRVGLLRQLWGTRTLPATSLAALSTRSAAALRAYLDGERLINEYRMPEAADAFSRAIQADSSFWFAYWRLAWAREFSARRVDSATTAAYRAHRNEFNERDRLLIEARMAPGLPDRIELSRKVAERFPNYWPAWLDYAEVLVHEGPYAGRPLTDAREPLERALRLNPRLLAAWDHLMWIALTEVDTAASGRALSALERLGYDSSAVDAGGFQALLNYRFLDRMARTGAVDSALVDSLARNMILGARPDEGRFQGGQSRYGFHAGRIELGRRILRELEEKPARRAFEWGELATTWASRGAWDSALVAADSARAVAPDPPRELFAYRLAAVGAFLGMLDTSIANARRANAELALHRLQGSARAELAWVDGMLAAARHDSAGLMHARASLQGIDLTFVPQLDSSLMALELELAGKRRKATDVLFALEMNRYNPTDRRHPYLAGINRLVLGRWLRDAGRNEEAARLLMWTEAVIPTDGQTAHANAMLSGFAYLERARLEDAQGQPEVARSYYEQFLRRFDMPPAQQQYLVNEARAAIARRSRR